MQHHICFLNKFEHRPPAGEFSWLSSVIRKYNFESFQWIIMSNQNIVLRNCWLCNVQFHSFEHHK